jgi:DNA-binding transcriptional regulator YhcF (GntR family)
MRFDQVLYFQDNKPLYAQVSEAVINLISRKQLKLGDRIPSITKLSEEYMLSKDTVEKAYNDLMKKGIITSIKGRGYYVSKDDVNKTLRVLLIFNKLSTHKKQVYDGIVKTLGTDATIDLSVHHSNVDVLNFIVDKNRGIYDYYMIMPHFYKDNYRAAEIIAQLDKKKVIILDKKIENTTHTYSAVVQDFEKDILEALNDGVDLIKKYRKLILVFPKLILYPTEIARGFKLFCKSYNFEFEIVHGVEVSAQIERGIAYVVVEESDLVALIKICKQSHLKPGKDIGILSYNDTPLKEILVEGITVISTDHFLMGVTAANLILESREDVIKNPFSLIRRHSL